MGTHNTYVIILLVLLLTGCGTKEQLVKCQDEKSVCDTSLSAEKANYQACSATLGSCQEDLGVCSNKNTELQVNYNSLSGQFDSTSHILNNCQTEREKLVKQIQTTKVGGGVIFLEILVGFAWIFIGRAMDEHEIKTFVLWFMGILFLTLTIIVALIFGLTVSFG